MSYVIFNGEIVKRGQVKIDFEDRGYQFGDGIYEVIRIYNGKPFALKEHLDRLYASAEKIYMDIPYTKGELEKMIYSLLDVEGVRHSNLYIQYSRGVAARDHVIPEQITGTLIGYLLGGARPINLMENGIRAVLAEDKRWHHCDIKSTSLLGNILAKKKATDAGCDEAILHRDQVVTEGSSTNVWVVKDGTVFTRPADHFILNGITRMRILSILAAENIPHEEKAFTTGELLSADEVFISSTTKEIVPVIEVDGKKISNGWPGEMTKKLQSLFVKEIEKECGRLKNE